MYIALLPPGLNLMSLDISVAATWETPLQVLMCPIFHREGKGNVFVFNDCSLAKSHLAKLFSCC